MQNFKYAILATILTASFAGNTHAATPTESLNVEQLSTFDQATLKKAIKDAHRAFGTIERDAFQFPLSSRELQKMTAWILAYFAYLNYIAPPVTAYLNGVKGTLPDGQATKTPGLLGENAAAQQVATDLFVKLLPAKLLWDRFGDNIKAFNRPIDAWGGYFYAQVIAAANKAVETVQKATA